MPVFYSHAKTDENGLRQGSKYLRIHTLGVRDNAIARYHSGIQFPFFSSEVILNLLDQLVRLHDLGKYTKYFQGYLLNKGYTSDQKALKSHARLGAISLYNQYQYDPVLAYIAYFIVLCHHRNLFSPNDTVNDRLTTISERSALAEQFEQQVATIVPYIEQIEGELRLPKLWASLQFPDGKNLQKWLNRWINKQSNIQHYFLINFLFSLLIEADKLDASDTSLIPQRHIPPNIVEGYLANNKSANNPQNNLRNHVRKVVVKHLEREDILNQKLFLFTAPTGIGKTLTALDFALRLRARLPHRPQIIVSLPFINIIEQTLTEYQKVLPENDAYILAHYQFSDIFGPFRDNNDSEEKNYDNRRMELDTWQGDVIVTSFVQLLQTMITNRNRLLLKFNHLAGAIVIMDEVQSIRLEQVPLIGAVIYCMSKYLNTRFILMTATKPLIFELADRHILLPFLQESVSDKVYSLLPKAPEIFRLFSRTKIVCLLDKKVADETDFLSLFQQYWSDDKSCLIVCNKVNRSLSFFESISKIAHSSKNPVYYLSTNVLPILRKSVIEEIKSHLEGDLIKPILIATQVVEAGVDLDFDMGFRDLGPIDSIVQVAGRINRENNENKRFSPLYIFDTGDCQQIYGMVTEAQARKALRNDTITEPDYFELVETYFLNISNQSAYDKSRKLFKGILHLQYDTSLVDDTEPIGMFKVIEESPNIETVYIEWDEVGSAAYQAFIARLIEKDITKKRFLKTIFDRDHKRHFHERTIAVPRHYCEDLPLISPKHPNINIRLVRIEALSTWYITPTGFNRSRISQISNEQNKSFSL